MIPQDQSGQPGQSGQPAHEGHHHSHDHSDPSHSHDREPDSPADRHGSPYQRWEQVLRELLIEKGIVTAGEIRAAVEDLESRSPALGARLVARAWTDPEFKARLLADGSAAARELGIDMGSTQLMVVENTPTLHNLIVCTLCSCYPRVVLGLSPAWYRSAAYRSRAVRDPRGVLAEFGTVLPAEVQVRVHDSTADLRYMVLPLQPAGTEGWSTEQLEPLVTRDAMIGVSCLTGSLAGASG